MASLRLIGLMAARDCRESWRARSFPTMLAVVLLLALVTGGFSWLRHVSAAAKRGEFQTKVRQQWMQQPDRHPHRVAHYGYLAFRPPAPLGFLDPGVEAFTGAVLFLEAHRRNPLDVGDAAYATGLLRFGELSPALVFSLLMPLLIVVTGAAMVSRERETGTLALVAAQGAPVSSWLIAKGLALFAMTAVPALLLGTGVSLAAAPEQTGRIAAFLAAHAAHLFVWCALTIVVGALSPSGRAALVRLLSLWALFCVLMPRVLPAVAMSLRPEVTAAEIEERVEQDLADAADAHNPNDPRFADFRNRILARYNVTRVEDLPVNFNGLVMEDSEVRTQQVFQKWHLVQQATRARQERLLQIAGLVNPYLALHGLSAQIAGSDRAHHTHYEEQAEQFRYAMIQRLNRLHTEQIRFQNDRQQRVSHQEWKHQEPFTPRPLPLPTAVGEAPGYLLACLAWVLGSLVALLVAARRLRVTS